MKNTSSKMTALLILFFCVAGSLTLQAKERILLSMQLKERSGTLSEADLEALKVRLLQRLQRFQNADLALAKPGESAQINLMIDVLKFKILPSGKLVSFETHNRYIESGLGSQGDPVYTSIEAYTKNSSQAIVSNAKFRVELNLPNSNTFNKDVNVSNIWKSEKITGYTGDPMAIRKPYSSVTPSASDAFFILADKALMSHLSKKIKQYLRQS